MLDRVNLKSRGSNAYKRNYWMCVVVAFILAWAVGGGGANFGSGYSNSSRRLTNNYSNNYSYNYDDDDDFYESLDDDDIDEFLEDNGIDDIFEDNHGDNPFQDREFLQFMKIFGGIFIGIFLFVFILSLAFTIFIKNPLIVGCKRFFTVNSFENAKFGEVGFAFKKGRYMDIVKAEFMKGLFLFLWTLPAIIALIGGILLAIPTNTVGFIIFGFILYIALLFLPVYKGYEYYMVDYIISEDPGIGYKDAIEQSKKMMYGYKWFTFVLELSFIGWIILGVFTCGILNIFMVSPYMYATESELFLDLRNIQYGNNIPPYYTPAVVSGYPNQGYNAAQGYGQGQPYIPASYAPQQPYNPAQNYNQGQTGYTPNQNADQEYYIPDSVQNTTNPSSGNEPYNPDNTYNS